MATMITLKNTRPMTVHALFGILMENKAEIDFNKPIIMSSDEEGNDMLSLYGIEINDKQITLYPAHL